MFNLTNLCGFMAYTDAVSGGTGAGPGGSCDLYWDNVLLLMHLSEANGSTTLVDEMGAVVTNSGVAHTNTTELFAGVTTGAFDLGDTCSAVFDGALLQSGDWTIELSFYLEEIDSSGAALFLNGNDSFGFNAFVYGTDTLIFEYQSIAPTQLVVDTNTDLRDAWHRFALTREGNTLRMFLDGVKIGEYASFSGNMKVSAADTLNFGNFSTVGGYRFTGNLTEIRVTDGVARYTSDYTVATEPFSHVQCL